ncbi:Uracil phosphoribosyltransferase [Agrobacterium sp. DSM 25558]|uniref:uracil phosphoribosyltransferase n=1 Tax=Agrobacterium sp. DSM 25558 TaxID=1907665 RepID=UPI00097243FA|nr:uracil phosphoribosyltransferase [Agrobacterium sp. DSM 25558]SCX28496.1 Uracil phosphoribosyltransferase [Agrobacterium sp. DSM 25558]
MSNSIAQAVDSHHVSPNVHLLPQSKLLRALHTKVRARNASRDEFVFYANRIIRLLIDASLELLPFETKAVETPVKEIYSGLDLAANLCGVSVVRSGESMEAELRDALGAIPIGKILIQRDKLTKLPLHLYTNLPADISHRHVLLLEPMLATGGSALEATKVLLDSGVPEDHIIFVNFLASPEGLRRFTAERPGIRIVTSSIERSLNGNAFMLPGIGDFGDRYFGTDS